MTLFLEAIQSKELLDPRLVDRAFSQVETNFTSRKFKEAEQLIQFFCQTIDAFEEVRY
jgi:hypothetical protein